MLTTAVRNWRRGVMLGVLITAGASAPTPALCAQRECAEPQPAGFRLLNKRAGPWSHALRFDAKRQQYVLTGPAPSAFGPD